MIFSGPPKESPAETLPMVPLILSPTDVRHWWGGFDFSKSSLAIGHGSVTHWLKGEDVNT